MKKLSEDWSVRSFLNLEEKGQISFDYPIQRKGNQWNSMQRSLLVHTMIADYPIPALFSIIEKEERVNKGGRKYEAEVYQILDGKQRLTSISNFVKGEWALDKVTPDVIVDGERIKIAGKYFKELEDELKEKIMICDLQMCRLDGATEEIIEDIFFRLQNGTPLTKTQQGKSKVGKDWSERLAKAVNHPAMTVNAQFTEFQLRKADDELVIIQTMMIMDDSYDLLSKSISSNHAFEYMIKLRENGDKAVGLYDEIMEGLDYIHKAFGSAKEKFLLKKIHLPMAIITALEAKKIGVEPIRFADWTKEFHVSYKELRNAKFKTGYLEFTGEGSVKAKFAIGRVTEMKKHFNLYINNAEAQNEELKQAITEVQTELNADDVKNEFEVNKENQEPEMTVDITEENQEPEMTVDITEENQEPEPEPEPEKPKGRNSRRKPKANSVFK